MAESATKSSVRNAIMEVLGKVEKPIVFLPMKALHIIAFVLLIIGGLNWLLVAFGFNLVSYLFGMGTLTMIIYLLVGLSAIYEAIMHGKNCRMCGSKM